MKRLLLPLLLLLCSTTFAGTITVRNLDELHRAAAEAKPGDVIILQNGEWKNVRIELASRGEEKKPITFRAQTAGQVRITGESSLKLGGSYIVVDGLLFTNGFAGKRAVIEFRIDKKRLANHCRVTNTVIDDFNNPKRMDQNDWISFYGKHNRLDHCTFRNKKNMGVLLAVILDYERSRENFHSIDHNHFAHRPPLGSNGGEIIRVGVSQHCEFNSNTQITDNFFEHCDGETEIVSIKSGSNVVRNNLFKECQGGVVLRHGDNNTVENNVFLGNNKEGTGGVRVINKGQWVINNLFYKCRGVDFRSPLSVMNGVPNSPAHRYVQVTEAIIAHNTFYECSSISFCEGSDAERSLAPSNVLFANNIFYNTRDSFIYRAFDDIGGFTFRGNEINSGIPQKVAQGFQKTKFNDPVNNPGGYPQSPSAKAMSLSPVYYQDAAKRLAKAQHSKPGFGTPELLQQIEKNAKTSCGAAWFAKIPAARKPAIATVVCNTAGDVYRQLEHNRPVIIQLKGTDYTLDRPFVISKHVQFKGDRNRTLRFNTDGMLGVFVVSANGNLEIDGLRVDGKEISATNFICSDTAGYSSHYNVSVRNSHIENLERNNGCEAVFYAYKSMIADSVVFRYNSIMNNNTNGIVMTEEKDDKGYYSAERIFITNNIFTNLRGGVLNVYRGGKDESTLGPQLQFEKNTLTDCESPNWQITLQLTGVQKSSIVANSFTRCNMRATFIKFHDIVRARHLFANNIISACGSIDTNGFVTDTGNTR